MLWRLAELTFYFQSIFPPFCVTMLLPIHRKLWNDVCSFITTFLCVQVLTPPVPPPIFCIFILQVASWRCLLTFLHVQAQYCRLISIFSVVLPWCMSQDTIWEVRRQEFIDHPEKCHLQTQNCWSSVFMDCALRFSCVRVLPCLSSGYMTSTCVSCRFILTVRTVHDFQSKTDTVVPR